MAENANKIDGLGKSGWTCPAFLNPIPTPALPLKVREFLDGGRSFEKMGCGRQSELVVLWFLYVPLSSSMKRCSMVPDNILHFRA
jgi:hypothetical protein